jgi:phosphotriesterase-related protein
MMRPTRRDWIAGALGAVGAASRVLADAQTPPQVPARTAVNSVTGPVPADRLGLTLMHEHVLVDFIGADLVSPARYDADLAFKKILPYVRQAYELGGRTLVECTPAYLGRDVTLLRRLSEASGMTILTNTGYYGAARDKHLPGHAFTESADALAARWIGEHERGIDGTPIKPAFMKIGVDEAPLSEVDAKLVRAAAITHRATGLPIASHTGSGAAALQELDILEGAGVAPGAFIWVHAQSEKDETFHTRAAKRGAWVEFDGIAPASVQRHVSLVRRMKEQGLLGRVLVSHDAGWYRVGEPDGGQFRNYDTLFLAFLLGLEAGGVSKSEIAQLLVANPRRALLSEA